MSFDFSTLVTDRLQSDVEAHNAKGTYNTTDLNRVSAAMEELAGMLRALGYGIPGYERIRIHAPGGGSSIANITPTMTSNTTPDGYIASASSEVSVSRQAWCAFDGISGLDDEANRWHSGLGMPQWIMMKFPEPHTVTKFSIKNADNTHLGIDEFELRGSNNGTSFVTLGSYSNPPDLGVITEYTAQNTESYLYYQVYARTSHHAGQYAIIDEIKFYEPTGSGGTVSYTWTESDIPLQGQMEQYLSNLEALRSVLATAAQDVPLPEDMNLLSFENANNIEEMLMALYSALSTVRSVFLRSGTPWAMSGASGIYIRN